MNKLKTEELEKFETIKIWKRGSINTSRYKKLNPTTWEGNVRSMNMYLDFVRSGPDGEMTPDDLIREARENLDKAVERLSLFNSWLQAEEVKGYKPRMRKNGKPAKMAESSARMVVYGRIQGFYSRNRIPFDKITPPKKKPKVRETDTLYPIVVRDKETKKAKRSLI